VLRLRSRPGAVRDSGAATELVARARELERQRSSYYGAAWRGGGARRCSSAASRLPVGSESDWDSGSGYFVAGSEAVAGVLNGRNSEIHEEFLGHAIAPSDYQSIEPFRAVGERRTSSVAHALGIVVARRVDRDRSPSRACDAHAAASLASPDARDVRGVNRARRALAHRRRRACTAYRARTAHHAR
jgi:hypothetical protein